MEELDNGTKTERDFTWVKTYPAIADALRGRNSKDPVLLTLFNEASNKDFDEVDPFSFFASFNRGLTWENRTAIIQNTLQALSIQKKAPEHFEGIPVADSRNYLYHSSGMDIDCENCWTLFNLALSYADDRDSVKAAEFADAFDKVMQIKNVGHGKLTMALYWIRPTIYMPLDNNSKAFLAKHFNTKVPHTGLTGTEYLSILDMIHSSSDAPVYELSANAYDETRAENGWKPSLSDYNPGFSIEDWVQMLNDKELFSDNGLALLKRLLDFGGEASCAQLSEAYGEEPNFYNRNASTAAEKIYGKTGCPLNTSGSSEDAQYWPILFFSKAASKKTPGNLIWKLRPELEEALKAVDLSQIPLHANRAQGAKMNCWLLTLSPGMWSFDSVKYTTPSLVFDDEMLDNPPEVSACFRQVKQGDLIIGFQGSPQNEAVCICRVEESTDDYFSVIKIADAFVVASLAEILKNPVLSGNSKIRKKFDVLLAPLTREEFSCFVSLMGLSDYSLATDVEEEETMPKKTSKVGLNTILYGPPGTGKTFMTKAYAVGICDGEDPKAVYKRMENDGHEEVAARYKQLVDEGRVAFITFHQSYGYEEFIEGIRPVLDSDDDSDESGQIHYDLFDGAFKKFCRRGDGSTEILPSVSEVPFFEDNPEPTVWKVGLNPDSVPDLYKKCHEDGVIRLGWDQVPFGGYETDETITTSNRACIQSFEEEMQPGDLFVVPASDTKLVSVGVITGECEWNDGYASAKRLRKVQWLGDYSKKEFKHLNGDKKLTLKTIYKLNRVNVVDLLTAMGKVPSAPSTTIATETKPYVFIIDEINRGEISKIFGELITLLEDTKRLGAKEERKVQLPYSGDSFGVPSNVYVIGTMNSADRSTALIDTALRRRFVFEEMMPEPETLAGIVIEGINVSEMLSVMNKRIEFLFDREHTIGHAYFISLKSEPSMSRLSEIFRTKIIPLLQEYFFDDYSKICAVLGDAAEYFIERVELEDSLFLNADDVRPAKEIYHVLSAPAIPEAYRKIYAQGDEE